MPKGTLYFEVEELYVSLEHRSRIAEGEEKCITYLTEPKDADFMNARIAETAFLI